MFNANAGEISTQYHDRIQISQYPIGPFRSSYKRPFMAKGDYWPGFRSGNWGSPQSIFGTPFRKYQFAPCRMARPAGSNFHEAGTNDHDSIDIYIHHYWNCGQHIGEP